MENDEFVSRKAAMIILGISSETTMIKYEKKGKIKVYRPLSNRTRYKVSDLLKLQNKG
jgi:predicted site-specific integrase-resolvase